MVAQTVAIVNRTGLHARPAGVFVEAANRFSSSIAVRTVSKKADGKSVLSLMLLAVLPGTEITIEANGEDEREALSCLVSLIEARFGE